MPAISTRIDPVRSKFVSSQKLVIAPMDPPEPVSGLGMFVVPIQSATSVAQIVSTIQPPMRMVHASQRRPCKIEQATTSQPSNKT